LEGRGHELAKPEHRACWTVGFTPLSGVGFSPVVRGCTPSRRRCVTGTLAGEMSIENRDTMAKKLTISDLDAEHVELLPARTLMTALLVLAQATGAGAAFVGATSSGGVASAAPAEPPHCADIPPWAPKPPECWT
jgi:hypothetical protein